MSLRLDLPYWTFEGPAHGRLFAVHAGAHIDAELEVLTPSEARAWLRRWLLDPTASRELLDLHRVTFGALSASGWALGDVRAVLEHDIGRAIEHGRILVVEPRRAGASARPDDPEPPSNPPSTPPEPPKRPTWIEVELLDEKGARTSANLRITPSSGSEVSPEFDGFVRVEGIDAGTCDVEFRDIDGREWGAPPRGANSGKSAVRPHPVELGECASSIARRFGFASWRTLWDDRHNAELRKRRPNPNALARGDILFVPVADSRVEERPTEQRATFRMLASPTRLRLRFEGRSVNDYELRADGRVLTGRVGPGGLIDELIAADTTSAVLVLRPVDSPDQEDRWTIELGVLPPIAELRGVQARLDNLGFSCPVDGRTSDETTRAVRAYQRWRNVGDGEGTLDDATRADLEKVHEH